MLPWCFPGAGAGDRGDPPMVHRTRVLEGSGGHLKRLAACLWHGAADIMGFPALAGQFWFASLPVPDRRAIAMLHFGTSKLIVP